ncbi:MAG: amidohydrolase family protein [Cellulomonas sp.]|jgi:imidazolonepropionase-like amidohydrolase|nr:amidohydrolase family protein [Cellulomonas sp.]
MNVIALTGRIVTDDERETGQAWVVGDRLTFERPDRPADQALHGVVLPGLVDVHCHIGLDRNGATDRDTARRQALADRDCGVLAIRDAGSPQDTSWVADEADLPQLVRAGNHLARTKRYIPHYARELDDPDDLPTAVSQEAARGDGWVKLVGDWIDRSLGAGGDLRPLWTATQLREAIDRAHAQGARVTTHTFATETLDDLLDAGVDCLEHATGADADQIARIAAAGIPVTVTLLQIGTFDQIADAAHRFPVFAARMRAMHARRRDQARDLYDAGVPILVGTDAGGGIAHGRLPDEAAAMVAAGLPAADVVAAASWRTRAWLGLPGLTEGASADLVVYPADPRTDIRVLTAPEAVVLRGVRVR